MGLIELKNISKKYSFGKGKKFYALKDFSFVFPHSGFFSIVGKSGSGKTTLLNIISLIDSYSRGQLFVNNKNVKRWKKKDINRFHNRDIGVVFQNDYLLEEESVFYNVTLPLSIRGYHSHKIRNLINDDLLQSVDFTNDILKKRCSELSGGEKQRVALLRALINKPKILVADEPTGSIDQENAKRVMDILKRYSKDNLVILVSHNTRMVEEYSDVILTLNDGELVDVENKNNVSQKDNIVKKEKKKEGISRFSLREAIRLIKRKFKQSFSPLLSIFISSLFSILGVGFINNSETSIKNASHKQIDYGVMDVCYQETTQVIGSNISLVKERCPTYDEIDNLTNNYQDIIFQDNLEYFFPKNIPIYLNKDLIENLFYTPIYSFDLIDESYLIEGALPIYEDEVLINRQAKNDQLFIGQELSIKQIREINYFTNEENTLTIKDYFVYEKVVKVVGIIDDFGFLSQPKIYYSYLDSLDDLKNSKYENYSLYSQRDISFYEYMRECHMDDEIHSYSFKAFYIGDDINTIDRLCLDSSSQLRFSSLSHDRQIACLQLTDVIKIGIEIFVVLTIIGGALITGIVSYASFVDDYKKIAISMVLGADQKQIATSYLICNLFIGLLGLLFAFLFSPFIELILNRLIFSFIGIESMIKIPFLIFLNGYLFLEIIMILSIFVVISISTLLPIMINGRIQIKEVLKGE